MTSTWTNLLWKEWREHAGKMLALCVIAVVAPIGVSIWNPESVVGNTATALTLLIPLGAMFLGMGIAASEQSRGTIRFLQALPTPMARPAGAKLLVAIATIAAPVIAGVVACSLFHYLVVGGGSDFRPFGEHNPVWGLTNWQLASVVAGVLGGASLLVWMAALGVNRSDEIRAGAVGLLTIVGVWAIVAFVLVQTASLGQVQASPYWFRLASAALPGGAAVPDARPLPEVVPAVWPYAATPPGIIHTPGYWPYALAALVGNGAMAAWYLLRFGRTPAGRRQVIDVAPAAPRPAWLAPPRRTPLGAILWKQARETLPLALMGAAVIPLVTYALVQVNQLNGTTVGVGNPADGLAVLLVVVWIIIGSFVAIVAGVGLFLDDLRPGLHGFWRSRPINVNRWFAVKVVAGAAFTLLILALPAVLTCVYADVASRQGPSPADYSIRGPLPEDYLAAGLVIHFGMFAAAVAAITLVRQPIYAAILALGAAAFTGAVADWMDKRFLISESAILAGVVIASLLALVAAWLAVRNDWGWKG